MNNKEWYAIGLDTSQFDKAGKQVVDGFNRIESQARQSSAKMDNAFNNILKGAAAYLSVSALSRFGREIINVRGEFQQLEIAFETMLGSKAKADQLMQEAITFASKTPFTLTDVAANIKQLMAMGIATENVIDTMKALGDVAAGVSVPISRVAINYGQVATMGKLQGRELRDFAMAGIPLVDELAKNLGKAKTEIQDMVEAGQIGFKDVEYAFQTMASEGGKFYNLMEKQNASVTGQISNLRDKIDVMMNSIGEANEGLIYKGISGIANLVEHYEEVAKVLGVLITTYGAYKAAVITAAVAQKAMVASGSIAAWFELAKGIRTAKDAQIAFNLATKANPYGLILAGISAVVTALILFQKKTDDLTGVTADFTKNLSEATGEAKKLFKAITDSKTGTDQHAKAIQTVNDKYREYLPNLLTEKSSLEDIQKAQDAVTEAMARSLAFKAQQDQLTKLKTTTDEATKTFYLSIDKASGEMSDAQKGQIKALVEQYKDQIKAEFEKTGEMSDTFSIDLYKIFNETTGGSIGTQAAHRIKTAIIDLIESEKELDSQTTGLKTTYESYLEALGLTGQKGDQVNETLRTVQQQIDSTTAAIAEAEKRLTEMRSPGSTSTVKDIEDQAKVVSELKKQLELLTGVKERSRQVVKDIGQQISDLYKQLETADEKDKQIIAERIVKLQEELLLRERLVDAAVKAVRNESVPAKTTPMKQNIFSGNIQAVKGANAEYSKLADRMARAKTEAEELQKQLDAEKFQKTGEALQGASVVFQELANSIRESNPELADLIDNLGMISNIGANLASGNYFGAAATGIQFLSASFGKMMDNSKVLERLSKPWEEFEEWIARSNRELKQYIKLRDEAIGGARYGSSDSLIDATKQDITDAQKMLDELNLTFQFKGDGLFNKSKKEIGKKVDKMVEALGGGMMKLEDVKEWGIGFWKKSKATFSYDLSQLLYKDGEFTVDKLNDLINEGIVTDENVIKAVDDYLSLIDQLTAAEKAKQELLTATAASNIADSIIDGFKEGYKGAADFADNFESLMKDAVYNALRIKALEEPLKKWYEDFAESMESGGGLTTSEIDDLQEGYNRIIDDFNSKLNEAAKISGLDFSKEEDFAREASSKGFAAMSQDSANELNGRFTAIQGHTYSMSENVKVLPSINTNIETLTSRSADILNHLAGIHENTNQLSRLERIENDMSAVKSGINDMNLKGLKLRT
ncbi:tape measure protein [Gaoshiqia sp. Z1-71]|uniref:tape measure protein n=1 Tax=Gaoshiqia hydrogeniformans TaxID=3290090 RepID=UPI003BF83A4B